MHISHLVTLHSSLLTKTPYPPCYFRALSSSQAWVHNLAMQQLHTGTQSKHTLFLPIIHQEDPGAQASKSGAWHTPTSPLTGTTRRPNCGSGMAHISSSGHRQSEGLPPHRTLSPPTVILRATALKSVLFIPGCPPSPASCQ